jgi:predicted permease
MPTRDSLRLAVRSVTKRPLFSGVIILTLGLAIGANSAMFSLIDASLLRPLDVERPAELLDIYTTDSASRGLGSTSYPDFAFLRDNARGVADVFGYSGLMTTITGGKPEVVFGELVSGNYFAVTRAKLALGRGFSTEDDRAPGASPVVVISDRLWRRRFAADPAVVGKPITLNGHPFTVIGVAAPEFTGLLFRAISSELWAPAMMMGQLRTNQLANRDERWMFVKARLAPGTTAERATRTFSDSARGSRRATPRRIDGARSPHGGQLTSWSIQTEIARFSPAALGLLAAVGFVVLIAATNVGNLMFARAASRQREIAIRLALGASRRQLVTQLLIESSLLATIGGALGLGLAFLFSRLLVAFHPPIPVPISLHVGVDGRVVAFTTLVTAFAAVIFGLLPALQASRPSLTTALTGARGSLTRRSRLLRLRNAFLVPQMALSVVLLVVAGLFTRSVMNAGAVDPGFDIDHTAMISLSLNLDGYDSTRARTFYQDLARRAESNGIRSLSVVDRIPLDLYGNQSAAIRVASPVAGGGEETRVVQFAGVDARYFQTIGIPVVRGVAFTDSDVRSRAPIAIVSETMARRLWPNAEAVGQTLRLDDGRALRVVGIARDAKVQSLGEAPQPFFYRPIEQNYAKLLRTIVRSSDNPSVVVEMLRREVAALDPNVAIFESTTMTSHLGVMLFPYRAAAMLSAVLGAFGLLLSSVGLFGVVAFSVARRTREFGIRLALGSTSRGVVHMVLREQVRVIALSIGLGLALALGAARLLSSVVFGIGWADPVTLVAVVAGLAGVALVSSYVPAARATLVNPVVALREE